MKKILEQGNSNNKMARETIQKRQPTSNEIAAAISQMNSILTATGNHAQIKDNKIVMILHADFDGICISHILKTLLRAKGYRDNQILVEFADNYNFEEVSGRYIGDNPQKITHLLIADIAGITKTEDINNLAKQGVNVVCLDHHENRENQNIADKYPWAEFDTKNNKCSTIQVFLMLLKVLKDNDSKKRGTADFINDYLAGSEEAIREFLIEELQELENPEYHKNAEHCFKFFDDILKISKDDIKNYKSIFSEYVKLSKAVNAVISAQMSQLVNVCKSANLIDNRKQDKMDGLDLIMDVWDLLIYKHGLKKIDKIFTTLQGLINGLPESKDEIKRKINRLRKETNYSNRLRESENNIIKFEFFDKDTKKYIKVKVTFAQGDTRFKIEGLRGKQEHQDADMFITFTDVPVVKNPIFTMKPTHKEYDAREFARVTKKDEEFMEGSKTGIALQYSRESYDKLNQLNKVNAELSSHVITVHDKRQYNENMRIMKEIMLEELMKKFIEVKLEREIEDKLESKFEF